MGLNLGRVAKAVGSGGVSELTRAFNSDNVEDQIADSPEEQARRANLEQAKQTRQVLAQRAKDFRANLPNYQNQVFEGAQDQQRGQLQGQIGDIKSNMSHRGLLYSGLNQGAQAQAGSAYAQALARKRGQINEQTESAAQDMDNRAIQAGFQEQQVRAEANKEAYERALARSQSRSQAAGGIFGAIGGMAGKAAGAG